MRKMSPKEVGFKSLQVACFIILLRVQRFSAKIEKFHPTQVFFQIDVRVGEKLGLLEIRRWAKNIWDVLLSVI